MYGNVSRIRLNYKSTRTTWSNVTVRVRRCKDCRDVHRKAKWITISGIVLANVTAIGGIALSSVMVGHWGGIWWPAMGSAVVAFITVPALWQKKLLQDAETREL